MQAATFHDSAYSWVRLAVTLLIGTIGSAGMWVIVMVMPALEAEFALTRAEAALPYTAVMIGFAIGNLAIGRAVDRHGVTVALGAAGLIASAGFAASALSPSVWTLAAAQFALGLGAASSFGPLMADVSHWFMRRRGIAVAIVGSGNYFAGALWPLILSDLLAEEGWRGVYAAMAAITFIAIPALALLLRRRPTEAGMAKAAEAARAASRAADLSPRALQALLCVAGLACCIAMAMPQVHIVSYCVDLGYGPAVGAEMLSLMLVGGAISRICSGAVADWLGGVRTCLIGSALQAMALALYIPFDGLASLYAVSLIFGLSQGGIVPMYAIIVREYLPPAEAGARVGLVITSTILGMAVGGWATGWIFDLTGSYAAAFLHGIAWNILNLGIVALVLTRGRPGRLATA